MRFAILYSKKDQAGRNIAEQLEKQFLPQIPLIELSKESIYSENIDDMEELKNTDLIIFASKHQSKAGGKTLSVHAPGNWRNADFGGKPGKVCKTSTLALKFLLEKMQENKDKSNLNEYQTTMECTHHGPLIKKPCLFIEVGATEIEWQDKEAAKVIAKTLEDFQNFDAWKNKQENSKENKKKIVSVIAIGGPHYCPNFNKIQLSQKSNIAIGHVIPEYHLPINESMLKEALEKTQEQTNTILLDWKGAGNSESRQKILELCKKLGLDVLRTDQIEK